MPTLNPYATTQTPTGAPTTATQPSYSYTGAPQETTNQTSGNPPNYARTPTTNTQGTNTQTQQQQPPNPWGTGAGGGTQNPWAANFGQPMYPWLMPYQGQFTAPMSGPSQQALGSYGNFVQGGQGMGPASNYINSVLGGQFLNFGSNPWLQQIQSSLGAQKQYEDQQAIDRIKSGMAAGGNAVSGATAGAIGDYLGQSGNRFNTLIGNLMNQNYGMERGFMNQAPGQLAGIAGQTGAGYGQLFNMGDLPRQIQQSDLNSQYQDFNRQIGGMQGAFQYPDLLTQQLLYGGGFRGQYPNQFGSSLGDLLGQMAGQNNWGGTLTDLLGGLFGSGGAMTAGGGNQDGIELGHDAGTPSGVGGPVGYGDTGWYQNALAQAQQNFATQQANQKKPPPGSGTAALIGLLMNLLGGNRPTSSRSGRGGGSQGGGGGPQSSTATNLGKMIHDLFTGGGQKPSSMYSSPIGPNNMGPYQDFLNQEFGGNPASTYGMSQYADPTGQFQQLMQQELGNQSMGGFNPSNFGPGGDQSFNLGNTSLGNFGIGGGDMPGQGFDLGNVSLGDMGGGDSGGG